MRPSGPRRVGGLFQISGGDGIDLLARDVGRQHAGLVDLASRPGERILVENDEIGKLAWFECAALPPCASTNPASRSLPMISSGLCFVAWPLLLRGQSWN